MKAKEALEILKSRNNTLKLNHKIGNRDIAINEVKDITKGIDSILPIIEQALAELEELKHYPTADEVCEAIQKELDYGTVEYVEGNHEFVFLNHGEQSNITDVYGDRYKITGFCKSSTITLIGRFYEGVEKVGKEE